jgi:hypothetical protein
VYNPANEKVEVYSSNVIIENNTGNYTFNSAINDVKGRWRVVIREVISGKETEVPVMFE